jgi:hypothetical protein
MRAHLFCALVLSAVTTNAFAETIDVALEDFQSSGVLVYKYNGFQDSGSSGVFRLRTSNPSGPNASLVTDPAYAFCIELTQVYTSNIQSYDVVDLTGANDPVNSIFGAITASKRDLVRQLWATSFDPSWTAPGPYTNLQITEAMAFHSAIYEILSDFDGVSLASLDLSAGVFQTVSGFLLDINDPSQELPVLPTAQALLGTLSLSYRGPLANLVALTNPNFQDYVVEVVPEASSIVMSGIVLTGMATGVWARRRKNAAVTTTV